MTREQAAKLWPRMKKYAEGKMVQVDFNDGCDFQDEPNPSFNPNYKYRIKPKPRWVPFSTEELRQILGARLIDNGDPFNDPIIIDVVRNTLCCLHKTDGQFNVNQNSRLRWYWPNESRDQSKPFGKWVEAST